MTPLNECCKLIELYWLTAHGPQHQHSSGYKKAEEDANKEAEVKLQEIKDAGNSKGAKVVEDLISALTDVKPEASEKILSQAQACGHKASPAALRGLVYLELII